jgi:hypothetical protein
MNNTARWVVLLCLCAGILAAVMPLVDFDGDGWFDSFVTDDLILAPFIPVVCCLAGLLIANASANLQAAIGIPSLIPIPPKFK